MNKNNETNNDKVYIQEQNEKENIENDTKFYSPNLEGIINSLQPIIKQMVSNTNYIQEMVINPMQIFMEKLMESIRPLVDIIT